MTRTERVLQYAPPQEAPPRLTLHELDGSIRVIFPVMPKWVYALPIAVPVLAAALESAIVILVLQAIPRFRPQRGPVRHEDLVLLCQGLGVVTTSACVFWITTAYQWWMYHRWGRVPHVLSADAAGLSSSRLGFWRIRQRHWPANELTSIEFRPLKINLNPMRTVAILRIRRRHGRRLRFLLSSPDPHLPRRIAEKLASTLGCKLYDHSPAAQQIATSSLT